MYLVAGMLLAFYTEADIKIVFTGFGIILLLSILAYIRARNQLFPDSLFGITCFLMIFSLGFCTAYFNKPENQTGHYIKYFSQPTDSLMISGIITEELKPTKFSRRFILETRELISPGKSIAITGKVLLNILADSTQNKTTRPGHIILSRWKPEEIKKPLNPFQFNYGKYLKQLKIEREIQIKDSGIKIIGEKDDISTQAWHSRERIISGLKKHNFGADELAVFQALILGQRREISDELYKNYAAAGAIHILAISGLHIGILLLMLNWLLKPLDRSRKTRLLKIILILLLLWSFAFLTGLSASVVRAVCMFSFIAVGMQIKRKTSSLNSIFLSLFFLLLINPYYLFQVGFQLSYLAVLSIIIFQPIIYKLWTTKIQPVDYFWKLTSVSLAAQIGVVPLSLYYFHQFPGMLLLTNLIILPFLGIILGMGILVIILSVLGILPGIMEEIFSIILKGLNVFIEFIAGIESLVFSNIHFSLLQCLSLFLVILSLVILSKKVDFYRISFFLISILIFQLASYYEKWQLPYSESIVFHSSRSSMIGNKIEQSLHIYSRDFLQENLLKDYSRERNIDRIIKKKPEDILELSGKLCLVADTSSNYEIHNFKPEILILTGSPKVNLERLIDQLQPKQIVADGNNFRSYIELWRKTSENTKIPFHHTGEKGAYIIENKN
ncbi:ComEC/Rec2 family competence protein [Pontixanthobacter gangjinensis]